MRGRAFEAETVEITLVEEQVGVTERVMHRERIRLCKETITDHRPVRETVRKEQVDLERDRLTDADSVQSRPGGPAVHAAELEACPRPHQPPANPMSAAQTPRRSAPPVPDRPVASRPDAMALSYLRALEGLPRARGDNDETTADRRLAAALHGHAAQGAEPVERRSPGQRYVPQAPA